MTVAVSGVRLPLPRATVERVVRSVLSGETRGAEATRRRIDANITFLSRPRMQTLNREWKRHDRPTDVLAFALEAPDGGLTGDVYVCPAVARAQAREYGVPPREELLRLVVHGTLHVLGHDHPDGPDRTTSPMWRRQERYLKALS